MCGKPTKVQVWAWALNLKINLKKEGTGAPPIFGTCKVQFFLPSVVVFFIKFILKFELFYRFIFKDNQNALSHCQKTYKATMTSNRERATLECIWWKHTTSRNV